MVVTHKEYAHIYKYIRYRNSTQGCNSGSGTQQVLSRTGYVTPKCGISLSHIPLI